MEILREYFEYRKDGFFVRLKRSGKKGMVGAEVRGTKARGYRYLGFQGRIFFLHRLIYQFHHGECPDEIDHINRDPSDCRIENLRAATRSQNNFNVGPRRDNSSGVKGLSFDRRRKSWFGRVALNGKRICTGYSKSKETARQKLIAFQRLHHGEFYAKN